MAPSITKQGHFKISPKRLYRHF